MTREEFTAASIAILRSAVGWQTAIAKKLGVNTRTVRRWLASAAIPGWVDTKFAEMTSQTAIAPWPRDEWMIGYAKGRDGKFRQYIAHLQAPRFFARIVACDDDGNPLPAEEPTDVLTGTVHSYGYTLLCEIEWIDAVAPDDVVRWLEVAADESDRLS